MNLLTVECHGCSCHCSPACTCCLPILVAETITCRILRPCAFGVFDIACTAATCDQLCCKLAGQPKYDPAFLPCCTSTGLVGDLPCSIPFFLEPLLIPLKCICSIPFLSVNWSRAGSDGRRSVALTKDGFSPLDVKQGANGDCWLLAAMGALAEKSEAVQPLIIERDTTTDGRYHVQLFDAPAQTWRTYMVDTLVPKLRCMGSIATHTAEGELWPAVLEKAAAKHVGSYASLSGGYPAWALELFTGQKALIFKRHQGSWEEHEIVYPMVPARCEAKLRGTGTKLSKEEMHDRLCEVAKDHVMTAGCRGAQWASQRSCVQRAGCTARGRHPSHAHPQPAWHEPGVARRLVGWGRRVGVARGRS